MKPIQDHDVYLETIKGYGRTWMLSALHRLGLKQGYRKFTDDELAELLWLHTRRER